MAEKMYQDRGISKVCIAVQSMKCKQIGDANANLRNVAVQRHGAAGL